jgi:photosystem II stability/assembly factor-like uncharacterized protein
MQEQALEQDIVYALGAAPDSRFWLAARQTGLQRSDDGGQSWHTLIVHGEEQAAQPSMTALAVAPGRDQGLCVMAGVSGGVFVSKDGGETWTPTAIATPAPFITVLAVSPDFARDGIAFAASMEDGVFRSDDFGASWRAWSFGLFDIHVLGLAVSPNFAHDGTVYALTESGIYRSRNTGRSWQLTGFPMDAAPVLCMAVSPDFAQDGRLYAGTEEGELYRSTDRGETWQRVALEADDSINAILLGDGEMLVLTSSGAWQSTDAAQTWSPAYTDVDFGDGLTAAFAPQGVAAGKPLLLGLADGRILTIAQPQHDR